MENKTTYSSNDILTIINRGKLDAKVENIIISDETATISNSDIVNDFATSQNFSPSRRLSIVFFKCTFKGAIFLHHYPYIGSYTFEECTFESTVTMSELRSYFKFTGNCYFKEDVLVFGTGMTEFNITDVTIDKSLVIKGNFPKKISVSNVNTNISPVLKKGNLKLSYAQFQEFEIKNVYVSTVLISDTTQFIWELVFEKIYVDELTINNVKIGHLFYLTSSEIQTLKIDNLVQEGNSYLRLLNSSLKNANFPLGILKRTYISDCSIELLEMSGTNIKENRFDIQNSEINKLIFNEIYNDGFLTFRQLKIPKSGSIVIKSSNLGKADFIRCDFSKATLEFENSKITEVFSAETNFPKRVRWNNSKNHGQAQLAFGQLQTAFQKQGDTIRSLEYQSREIAAHFYGLKFGSKDFFKKLNLSLNLISNNFGRYWALGILFTFTIGLLFFILLLVSTDKYKFGVPKFDSHLIPAYLKFMNPLRFIETDSLFKSNPDLKLKDWSYLLDFLGRVFVAYGAYQTIQAFRRFGRK